MSDASTRSRLRVAMIAPPWYEVPPRAYGGTEAVVARIIDGLVELGHHVSVCATGADRTSAEFLRTYQEPPAPGFPAAVEVAQAAMAARALDGRIRAGRVDVVHDHTIAGPLLALGRVIPTVVTLHLPPAGDLAHYFRALDDAVALVAVSHAQRELAPDLAWVDTVHHGIDVERFPFAAVKDDVVCFLGRFSRDKGAHLAIDAARAAGMPIVLAGRCSEPEEEEYFAAEIEPRLGPDATHIGVADFPTKCALLARSRCMLFPIDWDEPFGLVMIEAMACGTPVVAFGRGAVPEVIDDGRTGVICAGPDELPAAIEQAGRLDPADCRRHVEDHFDRATMVGRYAAVYRKVIE